MKHKHVTKFYVTLNIRNQGCLIAQTTLIAFEIARFAKQEQGSRNRNAKQLNSLL